MTRAAGRGAALRRLRMDRCGPTGARVCGLVALLALSGCSALSDRGIVARAGDWTLTEERMAELLVLAQPFPLDSAAAAQLADHWVAAAALSQRAAAGDSLMGSEAIEAVTWAARREALLAADREDRLGRTVAVTTADARAVFEEGTLRLVAHVLRRAGPDAPSSARLQQQRAAERLLETITEGGSWIAAVAESEDDASKPSGGVIGLFAPGELPSTLDRVAFRLEPGHVSPVTQSSEGFHIIYRPTLTEVEFQFAGMLRERRLLQADVAANEAERTARNFAVAAGASATLGRIAEDPGPWLDSKLPLVTWDDGSLTAGVVARDFFFVSPSRLAGWVEAGPDARNDVLANLGIRELRITDVEARGMSLPPEVDESLVSTYADQMEYWIGVLDIGEADAPSREALERYMGAVVRREEPLRPLPSLFEAWLLGRVDTRVRARGVLAAIVQARRARP